MSHENNNWISINIWTIRNDKTFLSIEMSDLTGKIIE